MSFFFLMIRRPPRSTPLSLHDALPIWGRRCPRPAVTRKSRPRRGRRECEAICGGCTRSQGFIKVYGLFPEREAAGGWRSEEHTSELQSRQYLVCRLLLEKKKQEPQRLL